MTNLTDDSMPAELTMEAWRQWTERAEQPTDPINHPAHYEGKIECIDAMVECFGAERVQNYCLCNAFKYLWRCMKKHDTPDEDVGKASWYLEKYKELKQ